MTEGAALVPVEQREVDFYGDKLTAVLADDNSVYVSVRHLCDALGLNAQAQTRRIQRHNILADGFIVAKMATIKGDRPSNWLRVDLVPLWLSGLSTKAVKDEIRPKLERFQREAAKVLWEAFREGRLTADPVFDDLLAADSPATQAYKMAAAIMQMARQQILLEARVDSHEERLEAIEATLGDPGRAVTQDQAMQISQAVKAVAMALPKKNFGAVYGELYRTFGITSYKLLPAERFEEAMEFLTEWHQTLVGDAPF